MHASVLTHYFDLDAVTGSCTFAVHTCDEGNQNKQQETHWEAGLSQGVRQTLMNETKRSEMCKNVTTSPSLPYREKI